MLIEKKKIKHKESNFTDRLLRIVINFDIQTVINICIHNEKQYFCLPKRTFLKPCDKLYTG